MNTFAMVLVSIILIGIFIGFIFLVAKGADWLINKTKEIHGTQYPEVKRVADMTLKEYANYRYEEMCKRKEELKSSPISNITERPIFCKSASDFENEILYITSNVPELLLGSDLLTLYVKGTFDAEDDTEYERMLLLLKYDCCGDPALLEKLKT
jgi:hypothetical protein